MKKISIFLILFSFCISLCEPLQACTSAIFTGKCTPDGRPLMWKHRDTDEYDNRVEYFKGLRYGFVALTNSTYPKGTQKAWAGSNEVGFCIMNTASYNLKDDDVDENLMVNAGKVMYQALAVCKTIEDFEKFLDTLKRPMYVESNYGVIDAQGGAAYYEVNNYTWQKIDVNDPKMAPQGYLVYSNHSYTGRLNDGSGYVRYTNADNIIKSHIGRAGEITPQWIFKSLSRSFYHSLLDIDLVKENSVEGQGFLQRGSGWFVDQDFIPRESTTSVMVFKGVKKGEDPLDTVMWTLLGYPPVGVAVPIFVKAKENQPAFMVRRGNRTDKIMERKGLEQNPENALACDLSLAVKSNIFPIKRGNGYKYYNFSLIHNPQGTGYMQQLAPVEAQIFRLGNELIEKSAGKTYSKALFDEYYNSIEQLIIDAYDKLVQ